MEAIVYLCIYLIEAYIFYQYAANLFELKYSYRKTVWGVLLAYAAMYAGSFFHNAFLNIFAFMSLSFLLFAWLFWINVPNALFHTIVLSVSMVLCEALSAAALSRYMPEIWQNWSRYSEMIFLGTFSKLLYFFSVQILSAIQKRRKVKRYTADLGTYLLILISLCIISVPFILCVMGWNLPYSRTLEYAIAIGSSIMFITLLLVYSLYGYNQKKSEAFTDLQMQLQKEKDAAEYYQVLVAQDEKQKIMIHDIKNHLQSIALLNQQNDQKKIEQYLDELFKSDSLRPSAQICSHALLNAILCRYRAQCMERSIHFQTDIRNGCVDFLNDEEITALFCNLLDNAMEAIGDTSDSFVEVSVSKRKNQPITTLVVKNSCKKAPKQEKTGQFLTKKSDSRYHGYGFRSVKQIAEKHYGYLQAYYDETEAAFHVIVSFSEQNRGDI